MLIRKNLNKKKDLLIIFVFILLSFLVLLLVKKDRIYESGIVDDIIEKMGRYSREFDDLF